MQQTGLKLCSSNPTILVYKFFFLTGNSREEPYWDIILKYTTRFTRIHRIRKNKPPADRNLTTKQRIRTLSPAKEPLSQSNWTNHQPSSGRFLFSDILDQRIRSFSIYAYLVALCQTYIYFFESKCSNIPRSTLEKQIYGEFEKCFKQDIKCNV